MRAAASHRDSQRGGDNFLNLEFTAGCLPNKQDDSLVPGILILALAGAVESP